MSKTILAVDDSKTIRAMVMATLQGAGYRMLEAEDGKHALTVLAANQVDCMITDLNMPNMNGFDLIRNVRSDAKHKFIPILMLTTEGDDTKKQEGKNAGATGWIVKPFDPEKLVSVVKKVCP
jgi:two-component system, chemotaxis family, chemotaxis protein CheY